MKGVTQMKNKKEELRRRLSEGYHQSDILSSIMTMDNVLSQSENKKYKEKKRTQYGEWSVPENSYSQNERERN